MKECRILVVSFSLLLVLLFAGCATPTRPTAGILLPQNLQCIVDNPALSPKITEFSGKWFGKWDGVLKHILVVQRIHPPIAYVIYAWGKEPAWNINESHYVRLRAQIKPGVLKIVLGRPAIVTYRLQSDGTLYATYKWNGGISHAIMRRFY
jgi:hypothetical protein